MASHKTVLIIDDEADYRCLLSEVFRGLGWQTLEAKDGEAGVELAKVKRPELLICDLSLPRLNGYQVCRAIRADQSLSQTRLVISSGRDFEHDRCAAIEAGADEFLAKPMDAGEFARWASRLHTETSEVSTPGNGTVPDAYLRFWGVRGSVPTPGAATVRYGGNTSCLEVRAGDQIVVLDAGTGLRLLGAALEEEFPARKLEITVLLTHTHWDHIQGLPFFRPLHRNGNRVRILGYEGAKHGLITVLSGQMETPYFPITLEQTAADVQVEELRNHSFSLGAFEVRTFRAHHPGVCYGYRLSTGGCSMAYFPDSETRLSAGLGQDGKLKQDGAPNSFIEFLRGVDVLVLDSQYDREEYTRFAGWGHGCVDDAVEVAIAAGVRKLFLFHHDPDHDDARIDQMLNHARSLSATRASHLEINAASEGLCVPLVSQRQAV
jgi:phosphoribosyl 1,2-cyclic phosphodiesterase/ActR/RegA family two-component response regulator